MTESSSSPPSGSLQFACTAPAAAATTDKAGAMSGDASASAHTASRLLQSRVGRAMQRYDGATRLLACVVVLRRAAAVRTKQDRAGSASTACSTHGVNDEDEQVLIISSSKHPDEWILPKGGWESDETLAECALREAEEEAGVAGEVVQELGSLDFASKNGNQCRFHGFQLRVLREFQTWAESNRQRQWVSLADARVHLRHRPELLAMLERALQ